MAKRRRPRRTDDRGRVSVGQTENLRDHLLPAPTSKSEDAVNPRMPFRTEYKLTRDQEDNLIAFADIGLKQLEDQLGRTGYEGSSGSRSSKQNASPIPHPNSFFGKRKKYSRMYYSHVDFRKEPDTIYDISNLTGNLSQRITMQMIARAIKFFFGEPDDIDWFSAEAVGEEDETRSDKIKKHSRFKIDQCGIKGNFIDGMEYAFVRGEAILKATHQKRFQIYKRTATVLMQEIDRDPILDAHGDYIVQGDAFVDEMKPVEQQAPGLVGRIKQFFTRGPEPGGDTAVGAQVPDQPPALDQANGAQAPALPDEAGQQLQATGRKILKRDGVTVLPENPIWKEQVITRQLITFEGPESPVVYFEDFLCPETATGIQPGQGANLIAHLYDMDVMHVAQMFRGTEGEGDNAIENVRAAVDQLRTMTSESNVPKSAANQPKEDFKESDTTGLQGLPICQIAECYLTYDADGDGIQEEIMLLFDRRTRTPIYYEYLANVTVRGLRPFTVWRPMPVDQRWYGFGSMELFDTEQEFIDLQLNRYNFAKGKSGRIDWWNPSATLEGKRDPTLKLNHGKTYTLRDGKKKEDAYDFSEVPFDGEHLDYLLNLFMQMMQLKSGVVNSGDQQMSGLPSSDLATGINEVRDSGDELFSRIISHLYPGVKQSLISVLDIIYANMNRAEVFTYFNGQANEILSLTPDDVRDLSLNVTLELSRTQQRKALEMGPQAQALISWYYQMPEELQARLAPYSRKSLKAYGVAQADQIIAPAPPHRTGGPMDKPSSLMNAVAALRKSGVNVSDEDVNVLLQKSGMPPLPVGSSNPVADPSAPPTPPAGGPNGAVKAEPAESAV